MFSSFLLFVNVSFCLCCLSFPFSFSLIQHFHFWCDGFEQKPEKVFTTPIPACKWTDRHVQKTKRKLFINKHLQGNRNKKERKLGKWKRKWKPKQKMFKEKTDGKIMKEKQLKGITKKIEFCVENVCACFIPSMVFLLLTYRYLLCLLLLPTARYSLSFLLISFYNYKKAWKCFIAIKKINSNFSIWFVVNAPTYKAENNHDL